MRLSLVMAGSLILAATCIGGCLGQGEQGEAEAGKQSAAWFSPGVRVPAGTPVEVRLTSTISSETARVGDSWTGVVTAPVAVGDDVVIPVGSAVEGIVDGVRIAKRGTRAMLELAVVGVSADGKEHGIKAGSEPVVAGSTRARNLGAIAGGAAAGAIIGKAVGGDGRDAAIGGILGGAAATGAVAASKGYQVVLKSGTTMTFSTTQSVSIKT